MIFFVTDQMAECDEDENGISISHLFVHLAVRVAVVRWWWQTSTGRFVHAKRFDNIAQTFYAHRWINKQTNKRLENAGIMCFYFPMFFFFILSFYVVFFILFVFIFGASWCFTPANIYINTKINEKCNGRNKNGMWCTLFHLSFVK